MKKGFFEKLQTEVVYLWEDEAQMLLKSVPPPNGKTLAKIPPDGKEFKIAEDSDQVTRALAAAWEVTKSDYDKNIDPTTDKAVAG